ncbi:COX15/CtaA family protein [Sphingomonas bacterium]|uniref:COX15/CtaA family protein n=1 Tax=Sphingomonas bacterium TaxID=1895847 RepID=UPI0015753211|nr:COX15/CtaA family protein [Sphingomonas bacterium]
MLQPSPAFMTRARPAAIARWLWGVVALIVAMVVVGGITRLTESGLSITEWKPITGVVPPLTQAQWQHAFDLYKRIPEYKAFNTAMTLGGFKAIFFWEYLHRLIGRVIGLAFAAPLAWFWWKGQVPDGYKPRLVALLALGGVQGAIGWWMVASGLSVRTDVSHVRLMIHLLTALVILAGIAWTAFDLRQLARRPLLPAARLRPLALVAVALLFAQLGYGALTAGLDAGHAFNSWPLMGDTLFPAGGLPAGAGAGEMVNNPVVVQFIHRWLAFVAATGLLALAWRAGRIGSRAGLAVVALVVLQIGLGIATLLSGVRIELAAWHQLNAVLLLLATVAAAHAIGRQRSRV